MVLGPAPLVRVADVDGDLVFFDMAHDDYLAIARHAAGATRQALLGRDIDREDPVLAELLTERLLIEGVMDERAVDPMSPPHSVVGDCAPARALLPPLIFCGALLSLLWTLGGRAHRAMAAGRKRDRRGLTPDHVARLVARFETLRIFAPRTGRCFIQSLLLLRYLRLQGVAAQWTFGVRTHPFDAHCWVEWRGILLNDSLDHARWYTPIARF